MEVVIFVANGQISHPYPTSFTLINTIWTTDSENPGATGFNQASDTYVDAKSLGSSQAATPTANTGFNLIDALRIVLGFVTGVLLFGFSPIITAASMGMPSVITWLVLFPLTGLFYFSAIMFLRGLYN